MQDGRGRKREDREERRNEGCIALQLAVSILRVVEYPVVRVPTLKDDGKGSAAMVALCNLRLRRAFFSVLLQCRSVDYWLDACLRLL